MRGVPGTLLIYDIAHDGLRAKVANLCLDYGLQRIQYSAFAGRLSRTRAEELLLKAKRLAGTRQIDLRLFPICDHDLRQALTLSQDEPDPQQKPQKAAARTPPPVPVPAVVVVRSAAARERVALPAPAGNEE